MTRVSTDERGTGVHRALPADRWVRPVARPAAAAVRGVSRRFGTGGHWREMPQEFGAWSTVHNRFRQWRDAGAFEALLEGLIAEAGKPGEVDLSPRSTSTPPPPGLTTTLPGCTGARTSSRLWRRLRLRRTRPGQTGQPRRTKRAGQRSRSRVGRASTQLTPSRNCPPLHRPEMRPACVRPDRRTGRGQPAVHPRPQENTGTRACGRPCTPPDSVAGDKAYSSCGNRTHLRPAASRQSSRRRRTWLLLRLQARCRTQMACGRRRVPTGTRREPVAAAEHHGRTPTALVLEQMLYSPLP
ncbi:transposase [Streptomyces sp. RB17]|uniref:transposase n=1 Tax=Streptomyces sp. RB17 TaxID=2585197 RepID=UPI0012980BF6